eukprot:TRINITY_DN35456_c0_g1_i1.p3 TRINITY_DN35456_c0_g1~~TRINITY_DN35456_c0_g1_i1.p3  ORF type:complete len:133 (-),score=9.38 TRINITY_DN35456_c0_g1_i1:149-547(-)
MRSTMLLPGLPQNEQQHARHDDHHPKVSPQRGIFPEEQHAYRLTHDDGEVLHRHDRRGLRHSQAVGDADLIAVAGKALPQQQRVLGPGGREDQGVSRYDAADNGVHERAHHEVQNDHIRLFGGSQRAHGHLC